MEAIMMAVAAVAVVAALVLGYKLRQESKQSDVLRAQLREWQADREKIAGLEAELGAQRKSTEEAKNLLAQKEDALQAHLREKQADKEKIAGLEAELGAQRKHADDIGEELKTERAETGSLRAQKEKDAKAITALEKDLEGEREKAAVQMREFKEREAFVAESHNAMADKFKTLAQSILDEKQKALDTSSAQLLSPLRAEMESFRKSVNDAQKEEAAQHAALRSDLNSHITAMKGNAAQLSDDARALTNALKGDSKKIGDWGEITLERVLEDSGLHKDVEYRMQQSFHDDDGKQKRPDAVVYLPDNRHLIVDSKVSLSAFYEAAATDDKDARKRLLAQHVGAVRRHIDDLSQKHYADLKRLNAPDFVFLFMPVEPALLAALQGDGNLYQYAYKRKVILTSPTTLTGVMKIVEHIWQKERQNKNASDIAEKAGKLYDKFRGFLESMQETGKALKKAQDTHDKAMRQIHTGQGSLTTRAEELRKLGAKVNKPLSPELLSEPDDG